MTWQDDQKKVATGVTQKREWVGLTEEDWNSLAYDAEFFAGAEWAEAKLKEKNEAH